MTYCLNSKIAHGSLRLELPGRAPLVAHTRAAALEIGTRDPNHGVAMRARSADQRNATRNVHSACGATGKRSVDPSRAGAPSAGDSSRRTKRRVRHRKPERGARRRSGPPSG